jgi:hypothetical protein
MDSIKTVSLFGAVLAAVLVAGTVQAEPEMFRWSPDGNLWHSEVFSFDRETGITWGLDRGIQGPSIVRPVPGGVSPWPLTIPQYQESAPVGGDPMDLWPEEYQIYQDAESPVLGLPPGF